MNAYILIQAEVGSAADVASATNALDEILTAEVAMGPYDVEWKLRSPAWN